MDYYPEIVSNVLLKLYGLLSWNCNKCSPETVWIIVLELGNVLNLIQFKKS